MDGLRGVAALAVVALHLNVLLLNCLDLKYAHLSVDFFLLLSGFVISHSYDSKFAAGLGVVRFMSVRISRLYPMIIAGSMLGSIVILARVIFYKDLAVAAAFVAILMNFCMVPTAQILSLRSWGFPLNSPFWSLSVEFVANFAYSMAFRYLSTAAVAAVALVGVGTSVWVASVHHTLDVGPSYAEFGLGVARAVYPFSMGVLIRRVGSRLPAPQFGLLPLALVLAGALFLPVARDWRIELALTIIVFPAIIVMSRNAEADGILAQVSRWLGKLSFPLYATHYPIIVIFAQGIRAMHLSGVLAQSLEVLCIATVICIAVTLAKWVEEPAVAALRQGMDRVFAVPRMDKAMPS